MRISVLLALCCAGAAAAAPPDASFPSKPIRVIVGFTPGGGPDITARHVAHKLTETWRQQVIVDRDRFTIHD